MDKVRDMATGSSGQLLKLVRVSFLRSVQFMTLVNPRYSYIFRYVQKHKGDTLVDCKSSPKNMEGQSHIFIGLLFRRRW